MECNKKRKPVFIKRKWNHVVFSRVTILLFHPVKKAQNELASIYLKEQTEYIQNQIDKIKNLVEDRQSRIAWQMINKVSRRKSTA